MGALAAHKKQTCYRRGKIARIFSEGKKIKHTAITKAQAEQLANSIDPFLLPSWPLADARNLPAEQVVYFVIQDKQIVYIGHTSSLRERWKYHVMLAFVDRWNAQVAYLNILRHRRDYTVLIRVESACIARFQPKFNSTIVLRSNQVIGRRENLHATFMKHGQRLRAGAIRYGRETCSLSMNQQEQNLTIKRTIQGR